jgi:hypothetical protein
MQAGDQGRGSAPSWAAAIGMFRAEAVPSVAARARLPMSLYPRGGDSGAAVIADQSADANGSPANEGTTIAQPKLVTPFPLQPLIPFVSGK